MKNIVKDWSKLCEGTKSFDNGYFYTLFMDEITTEEIQEIYKYFINSDRLISKMEKYLFDTIPDIENFEQKKIKLEELIKLDFEERAPILEMIPVFSEFNKSPSFTFISDFDSVYQMKMDDIWSQSFHDFVDFQMIEENIKTYSLYDALYGLTTDFDYRLYLFESLLKTNYSAEHIFKFKRLGGVYSITKEGVVYSCRTN